MKVNKSIRLEAAILLTVFALNTVIAFACSLGLNMGFNQKHHHNEDEEQVFSNHSHHHSHAAEEHHQHEAGLAHHHEKRTTGNDGCCNDKAIKIQQVDKSLSYGSNPVIKAPVFIAFLSAFLGLEISSGSLNIVHKSIIPQFYPPPDIRIVIQSFQI